MCAEGSHAHQTLLTVVLHKLCFVEHLVDPKQVYFLRTIHVIVTLEGSGLQIITNTLNYTSLHCLALSQVHRRAGSIPPTIHQQQTANMLAHSVAAGAQAASVSSRKPLAVRAQAVSEVAVANGSSTSTAPPPRAKASWIGCVQAAGQQLNCCLPSASLRLSDAALLHACEPPAPAQIVRHEACLGGSNTGQDMCHVCTN